MSTYIEELAQNWPNKDPHWGDRSLGLQEACATVDALRDENARLKGLVVKMRDAIDKSCVFSYISAHADKLRQENRSADYVVYHESTFEDIKADQDRIAEAVALTPASMADFVCVKREEWDKAYGYAARIDKELDAIRVLADELACALNINKGKADDE